MDMDMDGKFHIHGKPVIVFIVLATNPTYQLLEMCQNSILFWCFGG